jgi:DNA-binding Lrp family transcriptional regulator
LGISLPTCLRRLSFLLNEKVIAVKALPNPSKLGNNANAMLFLRTQPSKLEAICAAIKSYHQVMLIMTLFNGHDIFIGLNAPDPESLYRSIKNDIMSIDGIVGAKTFVRAGIKKRYYGGFVDENPLQDKHDHL